MLGIDLSVLILTYADYLAVERFFRCETLQLCESGDQWIDLAWAPRERDISRTMLNPFTPKLKKYILPTFQREIISWVVRIGGIIIFQSEYLKLWKARFFVLCGVSITGKAAGEIWTRSLLGVKGLEDILFDNNVGLFGECHMERVHCFVRNIICKFCSSHKYYWYILPE